MAQTHHLLSRRLLMLLLHVKRDKHLKMQSLLPLLQSNKFLLLGPHLPLLSSRPLLQPLLQ
jgi:hypothetical protein